MVWADSPDLAVVGVSTVAEVSLALIALHFVVNWQWPAYQAKVPALVICSALAVSVALHVYVPDAHREFAQAARVRGQATNVFEQDFPSRLIRTIV